MKKRKKLLFGNIMKTLCMVFLILALMGCLAACGEEDSSPKKGKARDGKGTEAPTEEPTATPTGEPTDTPTPTEEPTPTPTEEPTPTPTGAPQYSGYAADISYLFGSWVNDTGDVFTIRSTNGSDVEIVASKWYTEDAGFYGEDNKPAVMPVFSVSVNEVNDNADIGATHTAASGEQNDFYFAFTEVNETSAMLQINHGVQDYYIKLAPGTPILGEKFDDREFFRFFNGFWTEEDSYNFVMIAVSREQRFTINFSSFYSEWGPTADIISLVKGCLGEGLFAQIEYDLTETTKGRKWMYITIDGKGCLEILDFSTMERRIYEKGIPYPDLASLAVPDIIYAATLCEEDAMVYLEAYNLPYLLNLWHPYVIEEVPNEKATFHEDYYGGTITIYSDASGKITKVETGK